MASARTHAIEAPKTTPVQPRRRNRLVLVYIALALAALVPGLMLKFGIDAASLPLLRHLGAALADIQFGSGLRFWLGVTGASLMALLLLYPLRKALSRTRTLGSIGGWFQLHILIGLLAPVCILYHANFGHGGRNANVALWSMLVVTVSGIVGTFVYGRASRDFYATRGQALQHRDAILAALDPDTPGRDALRQAFETFEAGLLTPRPGVMACLAARWRVERSRKIITGMLAGIVEARAAALGLPPDDVRRSRVVLGRHLKSYVAVARVAASRSIREQIWARWRLFHLPVFLIMIAAAALHVIAVWDMDAGSVVPAAVERRAEAETPVDRSKVAGVVEDRDAIERLLSMDHSPAPRPPLPTLTAPPQLVTTRPKPAATAAARPAAPELVAPVPKPAVRPAAVAPPRAPPAPAPQADIEKVYAELQSRDEVGQPMALGGAKPRTLAEQIATLKAQRAAGQFAHSESETGFPLTGKHLKVECSSCHTVPLRETRAAEPRACVACHKKDDVHSGRRPDCAQCHTTNRWTQIVRRR